MSGTSIRTAFLLSGAALLVAGLTGAPSAHAFGLIEAYQAARTYDPVYRSAMQEREAGVLDEAIARARLLPQASISYGYNRNWLEQRVTNPNTGAAQFNENNNYPSYSAQVQIRQPLINMAAYAGYREGQAKADLAEARFTGRGQELALRLFEAYSKALLAQDQLALAQSQLTAYAEQMAANDRLFKSGEGTRTDMIETRSRHDMAAALVIEATNQLDNARRVLMSLVGPEYAGQADRLYTLLPNFRTLPEESFDFESWVGLAMANNAQILTQRFTVTASDESVRRSRAGHMPELDLIVNYGRNSSDSVNTINQRNTQGVVGVQLRVPLYSGGGVSATTSQAAANFERARADLDARTNEVLVELRKQFDLVRSNTAKIRALDGAVSSAELLVEATRKSVSGGMRVNLDVLNAEHQLYQARRDLAEARYGYLMAYIRLRYEAGTLQYGDMEAVASYFAPAGSTTPVINVDINSTSLPVPPLPEHSKR